MNKKTYVDPELDIIEIREDILTASGGEDDLPEDEL